MTRDQVQSLHARLKEVKGRCLDSGDVLERWLRQNPTASPEEARACVLVAARCPFPSISGNPPVYRDRPYYDARYHQERDLHFESDLIG